MHERVGKVASGVDARHAGFPALIDFEGGAQGGIDHGEAQQFMQTCGRLVAWMRKQDIDRDWGSGVELDSGVMALVMIDFGDSAIDDRDAAARQIGTDIGWNVVTMGEDRQRVSPIVV